MFYSTFRNETGAASELDCNLCPPGYYCPNDTENSFGIPCEQTYECPSVSSDISTFKEIYSNSITL